MNVLHSGQIQPFFNQRFAYLNFHSKRTGGSMDLLLKKAFQSSPRI